MGVQGALGSDMFGLRYDQSNTTRKPESHYITTSWRPAMLRIGINAPSDSI